MPSDKIQKVQIVNQPVKTTHGTDVTPHKYPSFLSLDSEDLPAIKDWNVGKKYTLMVEVEQVSISKDGDEYGPMMANGETKKSSMRARFKILSVKVPGGDKPIQRSEKLAKLKEKAEES